MHRTALTTLAFLTLGGLPTYAITVGQIDTFSDGTTMDWVVGGAQHPAPPEVQLGGPGGEEDPFLMLSALGGNGPGSKLAVFNEAQWAGNYRSAGVGSISASLKNFGPDELSIRLLLLNFENGAPANIAVTNAVVLAPGGSWTNGAFRLDPGSLTLLFGSTANLLANVQELRLFHNPAADYPFPPVGPPSVTAQLGIDDLQAVPEPSSLLLLSSGALLLLTRRRQKP